MLLTHLKKKVCNFGDKTNFSNSKTIMRHLFKLCLVLAMGLMISLPAFAKTGASQAIKFGTADVTINFNLPANAGVKLDNPSAKVVKSSMFENPVEDLWDKNVDGTLLKYDGKSFVGKVQLELAYEWVNIVLADEATQFNMNLLALLSQETPTVIDVNVIEAEPHLSMTSNVEQYNEFGWQDWYTLSAIASFHSNNPANEKPIEWLPESAYKTWKTAESAYWTVFYPDRLKYIIEASNCGNLYEKSPAWVKNSSKWWFAANYAMNYVLIAKERNNLTLPEPPIEFYSFLKNVNFTDEFLTHFPMQSQKRLLDGILNISAAGIKPIGDAPVKDWQSGVRSALSKAFDASDLLLDILAAQSYVNQLTEQNKPLTATQISNIKSGFNNDLSKIILSRNEKK